MVLKSELFFFKQKTAYEMRISDWSSDVCSSDLRNCARDRVGQGGQAVRQEGRGRQSMMDKALRDRLIADPAISAIVGTRVYWIDRPQSASALPAIVLQKVSPGRTYTTKGATTLQGTRVQFDPFRSEEHMFELK